MLLFVVEAVGAPRLKTIALVHLLHVVRNGTNLETDEFFKVLHSLQALQVVQLAVEVLLQKVTRRLEISC